MAHHAVCIIVRHSSLSFCSKPVRLAIGAPTHTHNLHSSHTIFWHNELCWHLGDGRRQLIAIGNYTHWCNVRSQNICVLRRSQTRQPYRHGRVVITRFTHTFSAQQIANALCGTLNFGAAKNTTEKKNKKETKNNNKFIAQFCWLYSSNGALGISHPHHVLYWYLRLCLCVCVLCRWRVVHHFRFLHFASRIFWFAYMRDRVYCIA